MSPPCRPALRIFCTSRRTKQGTKLSDASRETGHLAWRASHSNRRDIKFVPPKTPQAHVGFVNFRRRWTGSNLALQARIHGCSVVFPSHRSELYSYNWDKPPIRIGGNYLQHFFSSFGWLGMDDCESNRTDTYSPPTILKPTTPPLCLVRTLPPSHSWTSQNKPGITQRRRSTCHLVRAFPLPDTSPHLQSFSPAGGRCWLHVACQVRS